MPQDYFGNTLRAGQRVLMVSRHGSHMSFNDRVVERIDDDGTVWVHGQNNKDAWQRTKTAKLMRPDRLVIHPADLAKVEGAESTAW